MTDSILEVKRLDVNEANSDFLGVLLCTDETSGVVISGRVCWRIVLVNRGSRLRMRSRM